MAQGQCNCGTVAFEITGDVKDVYVCHCSICRKSTGTNGIGVLVIPNEAFCWTSGQAQIASWKKPGTDWEKWFCSICASPLPGKNDEARMFVPAGLITEGEEALKVAAHIWVGSKAPWDEIGDDGPLHHAAFGSN